MHQLVVVSNSFVGPRYDIFVCKMTWLNTNDQDIRAIERALPITTHQNVKLRTEYSNAHQDKYAITHIFWLIDVANRNY